MASSRPSRNNRRRFHLEDHRRLKIIAMLRRAGLALDEVAAVISSPPAEAQRLPAGFLTARIRRLEHQLADARLAMERLTSAAAG